MPKLDADRLPDPGGHSPSHRTLPEPASFWHQVESRCLICGVLFTDVTPSYYCSIGCAYAAQRVGWPHLAQGGVSRVSESNEVREHKPEGELAAFIVRRTTTVVFKRGELAAFLGFTGQLAVTCPHADQDEQACSITFVDVHPQV